MTAAEIIAMTFSLDVGEVKAARYQPTRTTIPLFTFGNLYYCCPAKGRKPPEGFKWEKAVDQFAARQYGDRTLWFADVSSEEGEWS